MVKFYVAGVTKYDNTGDKFDVILKLEGLTETPGDLRIQIAATDLTLWVSRIGQYSTEFDLTFGK